jgi:hypothetical protein
METVYDHVCYLTTCVCYVVLIRSSVDVLTRVEALFSKLCQLSDKDVTLCTILTEKGGKKIKI